MSVINDMLKDLERRRAPEVMSGAELLAGVRVTAPERVGYNGYYALAALLLCALLLCVWLGAHWGRTSPAAQQMTQQAKVPTVAQAAPARQQPAQAVASPVPTNTSLPVMSLTPVKGLAPVAEPEPAAAEATVATAMAEGVVAATAADGTIATAAAIPIDASTALLPPEGVLRKTPVVLNTMQQAEERYQHVLETFAQDEPQATIDELQRIVSAFPLHQASRQMLVECLLGQGQDKQAEALLKYGLELAPGHAPYLELLAHVYVGRNQYPLALETLLIAQPEMASHTNYYALLAAVYEHQRQYAKAANVYSALLQLQPANAVWWLGLAIALEITEQPQQAVEAYKKAELGENLQPQMQLYIHKRLSVLGG